MSDWLAQRSKKATKRSDVICLYAPEGAGKTSFAAQFSGATFAMSENETGLLHLMAKDLVDPQNYFPEFRSWSELVEATNEMIAPDDPKQRPRTFVVDTIGGAQNLLVDQICNDKYGGEMNRKGFLSYMEGWDACLPLWRAWLAKLEQLRNKGTTIVLLAHAMTINHKNPTGEDYHRFVAELHPKFWSLVRKFADLICFLNFHDEVEDGKGKGGRRRVYYFERDAAFDAKNRHGLPERMIGKGGPAEDFAGFVELVKKSDGKRPAATNGEEAAAGSKGGS
jgi:hypothetical protein